MGRPLKIKKSTTIDIGFPNFGSLTDPVFPTGGTLGDNQFLGVVGGSNTVDTATYPTVKVRVNISDSYTGEDDGYIIRQKGSHKYLVGTATAIDPENAVVGTALRIVSLGDTDWQAMGASDDAAVGSIFTVIAASGAGTTGTASEVGVCVLTSDLSPGAGLMSISYSQGDSTETAVSKLTNKFITNWTNFQNAAGTSLTTYADGGNNAGPVVYSGEDNFIANFFTDEGTATKSGADDATSGASVSGSGTLFDTSGNAELAIVENYNS